MYDADALKLHWNKWESAVGQVNSEYSSVCMSSVNERGPEWEQFLEKKPAVVSGMFSTLKQNTYPEEFMQSQCSWAEHKPDQKQPQELVTKKLQKSLICTDDMWYQDVDKSVQFQMYLHTKIYLNLKGRTYGAVWTTSESSICFVTTCFMK